MIIAVIPCRSESKSVKNKNIHPLNNKPLMAYAIESALGCKYLEHVYVSTNSMEYASIAMRHGAEVIMRPAPLAEDVPTELVIKHAIETFEQTGSKVSVAVTMQCTTPLTLAEDVNQVVEALIDDEEADSSMTVCRVSQYPQWMFAIKKKYLEPFMNVETKGDWGVRQTHKPLYRPTGGVYASRRDLVMRYNRIIGEKCVPVIVLEERGLDIDSELDFLIIENMIKSGFTDGLKPSGKCSYSI